MLIEFFLLDQRLLTAVEESPYEAKLINQFIILIMELKEEMAVSFVHENFFRRVRKKNLVRSFGEMYKPHKDQSIKIVITIKYWCPTCCFRTSESRRGNQLQIPYPRRRKSLLTITTCLQVGLSIMLQFHVCSDPLISELELKIQKKNRLASHCPVIAWRSALGQ